VLSVAEEPAQNASPSRRRARGRAEYVELHCHSAYSFLDGASLPEELVERAAALGHTSIALTDHNSVSGAMEFSNTARELELQPILGAEVSVAAPRPDHPDSLAARHLTLLVQDARGWRNLSRLLTRAHAHTRDSRDRRPRPAVLTLAEVEQHAEGLLCLSGCATRGVDDESVLLGLRDAFSPQRLRIELQRPYARDDRARNRRLEHLARRLGVGTVATGNVHAHSPNRALLQDVLVAIRCAAALEGCETQRRPNHTHVLATPKGMTERFAEHPRAVRESARLAEAITFDISTDLSYRYPGADDPTAPRRLRELCSATFANRYPRGHRHHAQAAARLETELRIIEKLGLSGFFVLHHELLDLARSVAREVRGPGSARNLLPPGRGRGSSVSSIVCYLTGLSHIDPIEHGLAIGRFLHEDLAHVPDIDVDLPRDVREALIPRIHERYGRERSALVGAFSTFRARSAIREIGKALGLPPAELARVARASDRWGGQGTVADAIVAALGESRLRDGGRWGWLARLGDEAQGLPRHLSQHPGGMIISTRPLIDSCPVVPAAMPGRQVTMFDKDAAADAGWLKIDLLGLGMLSVLERSVELAARGGESIDLSRISFTDQDTYRAIQGADTVGAFQIESRAQMAVLRRTRPENLAELTIQVALVRPGPIAGGGVREYVERCERLRADPDYLIPYDHPSLRAVLADTLGVIIFQDQVLEVAAVFAGMNAARAEGLRRAMSRKRSAEAIERHHREFVDGAMRMHADVDRALAEWVWAKAAAFKGYGFPKGHAASFAVTAYQSQWMRGHRPAPFLCSLLNEQPMGFYPPAALVHEARRRGVVVQPPDVNDSDAECTVAGGGVRIGLGYIKGIKREDVAAVVRAREARGRFRAAEELAACTAVGLPVLERLAWSGACDRLSGGRRAALWQLGVAATASKSANGVQLALELPLERPPALTELDAWGSMLADYETTGVSVKRHPLALLRPTLAARGVCSVADLATIRDGERVAVGGLAQSCQRPQTASGVVFILLEDECGTLNVIVPAKVYEQHRMLIASEALLLIDGRVERGPRTGGSSNLLAVRFERLARPTDAAGSVAQLENGAREVAVELASSGVLAGARRGRSR
jgi:error-prone DNA polymerase